jgi:hypothetical protein
MRILGSISLTDVLVEWGLLEAGGRLRAQLPPEVLHQLSGPEAPHLALDIILQARRPLIVPILAAYPERCIRVEVLPEDHPLIRILGNPSRPLVDVASSQSNNAQDMTWVNSLTTNAQHVAGPLLGIARCENGPFILFDGVHRAIAWRRHSTQGVQYPLVVNVILTRNSVRNWE